jgi:hypothetical protein
MEGYLEKKGGVRRNWLRRWFAIRGDTLVYLTQPGGEQKGQIRLGDVEARLSSCPAAHPHELELVAADRTFRIRAASDDECLAWVAALCGAGAAGGGGSASRTAVWERGDIGMKCDSTRDPEGEARVQALGRKHEAAGTVFSDPDFPPDDSSLFGSGGRAAHDRPSGSEWRRDKKPFLQDKTVVWKRPQEILDPSAQPVVFSGGIDADDIHQGELGNCYFLAAMAACASHQSLIEDLVVEEGLMQGGKPQLFSASLPLPSPLLQADY